MKTINEIKDEFRKIGIIPVVVLESEEQAEPLAEALIRGGLPAAEVTFRTDAAAGAIRRMKDKYPSFHSKFRLSTADISSSMCESLTFCGAKLYSSK